MLYICDSKYNKNCVIMHDLPYTTKIITQPASERDAQDDKIVAMLTCHTIGVVLTLIWILRYVVYIFHKCDNGSYIVSLLTHAAALSF